MSNNINYEKKIIFDYNLLLNDKYNIFIDDNNYYKILSEYFNTYFVQLHQCSRLLGLPMHGFRVPPLLGKTSLLRLDGAQARRQSRSCACVSKSVREERGSMLVNGRDTKTCAGVPLRLQRLRGRLWKTLHANASSQTKRLNEATPPSSVSNA